MAQKNVLPGQNCLAAVVVIKKEIHVCFLIETKLRMYEKDFSFPHHYQGRIDFNTDNLYHSAGMDFVCIPASRIGLINPLPRAKIDQSSPCRGLGTHPRAMNTQ